MKLHFDKDQMTWLDKAIKVTQKLLARDRTPESEKICRVANKMAHKFAGNPPVVFLTGKERSLLLELVTMRLEALNGRGTAEAETVRGIALVFMEIHK